MADPVLRDPKSWEGEGAKTVQDSSLDLWDQVAKIGEGWLEHKL